MTTQVGVKRNLWATQESGLLAPKRMNFSIDRLEYYLPMWHPELSGATIVSRDPLFNADSNDVTGTVFSPNVGRVFDGDDFITQTTFLDTPPANVSFEFWFSPTVTYDSGATTPEYILSKNNVAAQDRFFILLDSTAGKMITFFEYNNEGLQSGLVSDSTSWTGGQFYHIVVAFDGSTWRMYVDGAVQSATQASNGFMMDGTNTNFEIGRETGGVNFVNMTIPEVRVYSKALSLREVNRNRLGTIWRHI